MKRSYPNFGLPVDMWHAEQCAVNDVKNLLDPKDPVNLCTCSVRWYLKYTREVDTTLDLHIQLSRIEALMERRGLSHWLDECSRCGALGCDGEGCHHAPR